MRALSATTYQEALRSLGALLDRERQTLLAQGMAAAQQPLPGHLVLAEHAVEGALMLAVDDRVRRFDAAGIEAIVLATRTRRGLPGAEAGPISDLLRAVGSALDDLSAEAIHVDLRPDLLRVRFHDGSVGLERELVYSHDDLQALREAAAARRKGVRARRLIVLHEDPAAARHLQAALAAEFAVESVPTSYASAVAAAEVAPDLALVCAAHDGDASLRAVATLRSAPRSQPLPILVVLPSGHPLSPSAVRGAGADEVLVEPLAAAQVRATLRGWCLRGPAVESPAPDDGDGTRVRAPANGLLDLTPLASPFRPLAPGPLSPVPLAPPLITVRTASVLFTDLRGFTGLAERFADDPADLLIIVNEHLSAVVRAIAGCGGVIEKFVGDGVLATFGARTELPGHRERAIAAAVEAVYANELLNRRRAPRWGFRLEVGVGVAIGKIVLGRIGPPERAELGVLGDPINVAARLVAQARPGEVLLAEGVYSKAEHGARAEFVGHFAVRGRVGGVGIYRLTPLGDRSRCSTEAV
ncbi:MAG: hypothetical protein HY690_08900 [Chloroflexi bacterium]|nr:hypothetical protein [Chloroflexota bacterium]